MSDVMMSDFFCSGCNIFLTEHCGQGQALPLQQFFISTFPYFSHFHIPYSVLKLFTGLAIAALIAWKLMVANAMMRANNPASKNNQGEIVMR